jgi:hypothetical protein
MRFSQYRTQHRRGAIVIDRTGQEWPDVVTVPYVEQDCTIEHEGRTFKAGGAIITDGFIIAYPDADGKLNDWHGQQIGTYRVLSSWLTPRSFIANRMYSYECFVNGVRYVGRGGGEGMMLKAKRSPRQ